ncbi:MAG TPA: MBL fold metallo-hydrolase [Bryobacteraceae bacterium]|nr:MBL fold metallo-hydrolase [Bryobacteraceae bacterium]
MQPIETETLREWLEDRRPVSVLDIRSFEDREQWSIPGSIHVNAYERLKAGEPDALANVALPRDRPVVTICNAGKVSQVAAEQLRKRGIDAFPLAGGMKSWSLAWNKAELVLGNTAVIQVRRTGKGCLSYLIGSGSEAVVVDTSLEPAVYLRLADQHGWSIRYVLDTHIHADHLSRSRALAEAAGAKLVLPAQKRVRFAFTPIEDAQVIAFGDARIQAMSTPGHTMESTCYDLNGQALFTGDTLFLSGVGRPDLRASADESRERAAILYRSLKRLMAFPPDTVVFPGHASQPVAFDRKPICEQLAGISTRIASWLDNEADFVRTILERIPPTPPNYLRIVELNEAGIMPESDPTDLEAGANRCAVS